MTVKAVTGFTLTPKAIELEWVIGSSELSTLRNFEPDQGDFEVVELSDGGWQVIDTSLNKNNTYSLRPPSRHVPPLTPADHVVDTYREQGTTTGVTGTARIRFVRKKPRSGSGTIVSQSASSSEWEFKFDHGTIATELTNRADEAGHGDVEFEMRLTPTQVEPLIKSVTKTDAVAVEEVPDGDDFIRDNSDNNVNTITISRPSDLSSHWLPATGDYIVRDWRVDYVTDLKQYDVSMTARKK